MNSNLSVCQHRRMIQRIGVYINIGIVFMFTKKKVLPFVTTWMNLEGIVLIEISQIKQ